MEENLTETELLEMANLAIKDPQAIRNLMDEKLCNEILLNCNKLGEALNRVWQLLKIPD
jgi:hypothetical protein